MRWGTPMTTCREDADGVTAELDDGRRVRARYVVGCDGGRSATRRLMGVSFDGTTSPTRWVVIDLANDPLGHPNSEVGADPERPYASISIAHGIRRFEFMIHADETDELAEDPAFVAKLLSRFVPHPDRVDIIRHRVYTHHSRIAASFRKGRMMLAGDAAHLMPVWQGQGYNSGIRDAANLGWKLAAVVNGQAGDALLDSYDVERRKHARAMIDLSTMVGRVISPTNRRVARLRDRVIRAASIVPSLKRYVLEMRFKPMPRYEQGAVVHAATPPAPGPRGRDAVHPAPGRHPGAAERPARRRHRPVVRGAVLEQRSAPAARRPGVRTMEGVGRQLHRGASGHPAALDRRGEQPDPDVVVVGDRTGALKKFFDAQTDSVLFLRPDRCIAGACIAQRTPELSADLFDALTLTRPRVKAVNPMAQLALCCMSHSPLLNLPGPSAELLDDINGALAERARVRAPTSIPNWW